MGEVEYGKCDICSNENYLERTYFYYNIPCECCGCIVDGKNMHSELVRHCSTCVPDIPQVIKLRLRGKIDPTEYTQTIKNMMPYDINGKFMINKFKIEKQK